MAISMSRKKPRPSKEVERKKLCWVFSFLLKCLYRVPAVVMFLALIFLWSSSTTMISGNIVHLCVSSRKLNDLFCVSAGHGANPNFEIPIPSLNGSFPGDLEVGNESVDAVEASPNFGIPIMTLSGKFSSNSEVGKESVDVVKANPDFEIPVTSLNGSFLSNYEVGNESVDIMKANPDFEIPVTSLNGSFSSNSEVGNESVGDVEANTDSEILIPSLNGSFPSNHELESERVYAMREVEEQLKVHRSWVSKGFSNHECGGREIYVYDLPPKFNKDLLGQCRDMLPWIDFCKYLSNDALGEAMPGLGEEWYQTHQYSLEPIFHLRVSKHRCRVYDQSEAKLFYVPFYGGLDILRWHFMNVSYDVKDSLGLELIAWLKSRSSWTRNSGKDHVFVLGKISWDFRRNPDHSWGTRFLDLQDMQNPVKLLIERHPWHENDIGIPHPTHFHPRSDDSIADWQRRIISSYRMSLVSFAGAARPGDPDSIRSTLIQQCTSAQPEKCRFLDCGSGNCSQPESVIDLFTKSEFCLQPPGDSPTRKSIFDSLVSGCIPVIFDPFSAYYQYPWHLPEDHGKYSVFIDQGEVRDMKVNVVERLMKISIKERDDMRRYIVYELLPGLVYADPNSKLDNFHDAFDITINNLFERVNRVL